MYDPDLRLPIIFPKFIVADKPMLIVKSLAPHNAKPKALTDNNDSIADRVKARCKTLDNDSISSQVTA